MKGFSPDSLLWALDPKGGYLGSMDLRFFQTGVRDFRVEGLEDIRAYGSGVLEHQRGLAMPW